MQQTNPNTLMLYAVMTLLFATNVFAIKCYQCTSVNDTRCDSISSNDNSTLDLYRECDGLYDGKTPFCRKTVQTIVDDIKIVRTRRSCGWEEDTINRRPCYRYENDFHFEIVCVCATDGCNAAPRSLTPGALLITMAVFSGTTLLR